MTRLIICDLRFAIYECCRNSSAPRKSLLANRKFSHAVIVSFFSVRGLGEKVFGRSASDDAERSASRSFIQRCWACQLIITACERTGFPETLLTVSRWEKLTAKIKTQTTASPVQTRRLGKISSCQNLFEQPSNEETKTAGKLCSLVAWLFNFRTTSRRMVSSFGAAA